MGQCRKPPTSTAMMMNMNHRPGSLATSSLHELMRNSIGVGHSVIFTVQPSVAPWYSSSTDHSFAESQKAAVTPMNSSAVSSAGHAGTALSEDKITLSNTDAAVQHQAGTIRTAFPGSSDTVQGPGEEAEKKIGGIVGFPETKAQYALD